MNKFPPPLAQTKCAIETENPALRALRAARDRAREHRRYELENFTHAVLAHARCVDMYDVEIATLNDAIATIDPRAAGETLAANSGSGLAKDCSTRIR